MAKEKSAAQPSPLLVGNKTEHRLSNFLSFLHGSVVKSWDDVEKKFYILVENGKLPNQNFGECIGLIAQSKTFAYELFGVLSKRKNIDPKNGITLEQLKEFWDYLNNDDPETRLEIFFDLCDLDDDQRISRKEIETVLKWTASANKLKNIEDHIEYYASLILKELDPDGNGFVEIETLRLLFKGLLNSEEAKVLQGNEDGERRSIGTFVRERVEIIKQNKKQIWVSTMWLAINVGLFIWKFMENKQKEAFDFELMNYCIGIAKGSAETLKFNMGLILFLVCRRTLTTLKSTFLSFIFPFDDHIFFHMMIGLAISLGTFIHMTMHLGCGFPLLATCQSNKLEGILGSSFESKQGSYFDLISSVPGVTGALMFIIMAYTFILGLPFLKGSSLELRKSYYYLIGFNAFWYAHHLLFLVYVLLILHGYFNSLAWDWLNKTTWKYVAFPILLYISEGLYTIIKKQIYEVTFHKPPAVYGKIDLVALQLKKPKGFNYESGSYLYVKCKDISPWEWHPFSITSAPGDEYLSLHIGNEGDWTGELIRRFKASEGGKITRTGGLIRKEDDDHGEWESSNKYPKLLIKGPYGAPSQDHKKYDTLLLIGFGVGATPMISILKHLLNEIKLNAVSKKAYFYWVTRKQESFEWFKGVMNDVARYDNKERVIEMNNYLSCIQREGDSQSIFLTILQNIQNEIDIISGSRVKAHYGRPDWNKVFFDIKAKHKDKKEKIGVFYCGQTFNDLPRLCRQHSDDSIKFEFHKENF